MYLFLAIAALKRSVGCSALLASTCWGFYCSGGRPLASWAWTLPGTWGSQCPLPDSLHVSKHASGCSLTCRELSNVHKREPSSLPVLNSHWKTRRSSRRSGEVGAGKCFCIHNASDLVQTPPHKQFSSCATSQDTQQDREKNCRALWHTGVMQLWYIQGSISVTGTVLLKSLWVFELKNLNLSLYNFCLAHKIGKMVLDNHKFFESFEKKSKKTFPYGRI